LFGSRLSILKSFATIEMTIAGIQPGNLLKYNGFEFDGASTINAAVRFIRDDADRVVVYQETTITAKAIVVPNSGNASTDKAMQEIRRKLGADGGILTFKDKGFGQDFVVNKGKIKDVKFGPKPKILSWKPIGDTLAAEIEWQVVTRFPVCENAKFKDVLALNYDHTVVIDDKSNSTRTVTGYIEIAQTRRVGQQSLTQIADSFRGQIRVVPLPGFKRTQSWKTSLDKSRVDFSIVDEQINSRNPWPQFVTDISARHDVAMSRSSGFQSSLNTLSANIELIPGKPGTLAYLIFLQLIQTRILTARGSSNQVVMLQNVNISEDIFGRSSRFSVSYRVLHCLKDFMQRTGLWQPLGTNWQQWATSVSPMFNNRGNAGLAASASHDAIISLCLPGSTGGVNIDSPLRTERDVANSLPSLQNLRPPAARSWLAYENIIQLFADRPTVRQSPIQSPADQLEEQTALGTSDFSYPEQSSGVKEDIIQEGGQPTYSAWLIGHAARVGYKIVQPRLKKIGKAAVREVKNIFTEGSIANMFGQPVFGASWKIGYILAGSPGKVPPEDNLKECVDGGKGTAEKPGKTGEAAGSLSGGAGAGAGSGFNEVGIQ
jgi:hypothetical protein